MFLFLSLFISLSSCLQIASAAAAEGCERPIAGLKFVGEVVKKGLVTDVAKFCYEQTILGAYISQSNFRDDMLVVPKDLPTVIMEVKNAPSIEPWVDTLYPLEERRAAGWEHHIIKSVMGGGVLGFDPGSIRKCLRDDCRSFDSVQKLGHWDLASRANTEPFDQTITMGLSQSTGLCAFLTLKSLGTCSEGLHKILDWVQPENDNPSISIILKPIWKEVMDDPSYSSPLAKAALTMMDKYEKGGLPSGNYFDDIKKAFLDSGVSQRRAEEMTWNTIAIISTGGPNTCRRALSVSAPSGGNGTKIALCTLSYLPSVLDSRSIATGHPYSYPPGVKTTCDFGKPYHFWMSAYLSRRLALENKDPVGSAAAAFTAQKGYEMRKDGVGRDPTRAFRVDTFDSFNNVMRMDMAFAGAGAWYGALSAQGKASTANLDVDRGLQSLVENAQIRAPMNKEESLKMWQGIGAEGYLTWTKIFSPDTSYSFFKSAAGY